MIFFFSSRRRHTRLVSDWSSDVCSSDLTGVQMIAKGASGETTVVGTPQGTPGAKNGFQYGYSIIQNGQAADKSGKDDNFRGRSEERRVGKEGRSRGTREQ